MQYPYLTFLEAITLISALFIGIIILYFLIRIFNKTIKFLTVLKAILFYGIFATIVYSIVPIATGYPESVFPSLKFAVLELIILGIILFLIFYFITKKSFQIKWWKSLVIFLLMVLIIFPFLSFSKTYLEMKIMNFSIFAEENTRLENQMIQAIKEKGLIGYVVSIEQYMPLSIKILGKIEGGVFSWATNSLRHIILVIPR